MKDLSKAAVGRALMGYTLTHEPSYEQSNGVYIIVEIDENFNVTEILAKRGRPVHTYSRLHPGRLWALASRPRDTPEIDKEDAIKHVCEVIEQQLEILRGYKT